MGAESIAGRDVKVESRHVHIESRHVHIESRHPAAGRDPSPDAICTSGVVIPPQAGIHDEGVVAVQVLVA